MNYLEIIKSLKSQNYTYNDYGDSRIYYHKNWDDVYKGLSDIRYSTHVFTYKDCNQHSDINNIIHYSIL